MPTGDPAPARPRAARIADARRRLTEDKDCWLATSGEDGPWLVPLSFVWHHEQIVMATGSRSRVVRDVRARATVRVALGTTRDVVMVHGRARVRSFEEVGTDLHDALVVKLGGDPGTWADALLLVAPQRVQAWREENELAGRELMAEGRWLE